MTARRRRHERRLTGFAEERKALRVAPRALEALRVAPRVPRTPIWRRGRRHMDVKNLTMMMVHHRRGRESNMSKDGKEVQRKEATSTSMPTSRCAVYVLRALLVAPRAQVGALRVAPRAQEGTLRVAPRVQAEALRVAPRAPEE